MPDTPYLRATCPTCETSYTLGRLGIAHPEVGQQTTVGCLTCGIAFDCIIELVDLPSPPPPWWQPWKSPDPPRKVMTVRSMRRPQ